MKTNSLDPNPQSLGIWERFGCYLASSAGREIHGQIGEEEQHGTEVPDVIVRFDYSQVAAEHREALKLDAYEIRSELITAATSLMRAGQRLTRWRDILPHGAWLPWVVAETGMSEQWARDAMNVFRRFGHAPTLLADLDIALPQTAIVRLATAPEDAFDDIIERVSQGERLRASDVTDIVKTHRKRLKAEEGETDSSALAPARRLAVFAKTNGGVEPVRHRTTAQGRGVVLNPENSGKCHGPAR